MEFMVHMTLLQQAGFALLVVIAVALAIAVVVAPVLGTIHFFRSRWWSDHRRRSQLQRKLDRLVAHARRA